MIKLCDLSQPYTIYKIVENVLKEGRYIKGPIVDQFEEAWAKRCGMAYCVAVDSGSMALELLVQLLKPISTFPWTYKAVWNAMDRLSGYHEFDTKEPDIYAHHLHDQPPKYKPLMEDCSHCHGYKPKSDNAIFSFYPTKILGACGDAGAIVTNSIDIYNKARQLRDHGAFGTNGRMDEIQGAILLEKLKFLDEDIAKRQEIVGKYDKGLNRKTPGKFHYVYAIEGDQGTVDRLIAKGVESKLYYDKPYVAIPLHTQLTNLEVEEVICSVRSSGMVL